MIKKFEDYLIGTEKDNTIKKFGEFRKGSNEYGDFIQEIMMFLRNFKEENQKSLLFKVKDINFDVNKLYKLSIDKNKKRLISFDVEFLDSDKNKVDRVDKNGYIYFTNLDKKEDRPWEKNEYDI